MRLGFLLLGLVCFLAPARAESSSRAERVRALYRELLDRGLAARSDKFAAELDRALAEKKAPSRFALFHAYGAAVRAADLPRNDARRAALVSLARTALHAYATAIFEDRAAMADQLLFCQNTVVRLYEQLVALETLSVGERPALLTALAAGADAALELKREHGAFNRAFHLAFGLADTARLLPAHPHAPSWLAFADAVWRDFTGPGDTFEDSSGYNGLWAYGALHLAADLGRQDALREPAAEAVFDRFLAYMAPNGAIPDLGNASYFLHGAAYWLDALERLGVLYDRADFQDAAERLAGFMLRQPALDNHELEPLAEALAAVAPARLPRPARPAAEITYRKTDYGDRVPDKLLLRATTPRGPAFVCVDLHDGGYHGHADGGALALFTLGDAVLLHELGRPATAADRHHTALAAHPGDGFPRPVTPAGQWTTWTINHRWPGTYTGQFTLDLARVRELFFRLQGEPCTLEVAFVRGERADGSIRELAGPWRGELEAGSASAFVVNKSPTTSDFRSFVRLHVRWRASAPASVVFFGANGSALNGVPADGATLRTWAGQPVVAASAKPDANAPSGTFARILRDTRGRLVRHERALTLHGADGRLVVTDRFTPAEAGEFVVGPVWHADELRPDGDGWLLADTRQSAVIATPSVPLRVTFSSPLTVTSDASGSAPATLGASIPSASGRTSEITTTLTPLP